ncbi:MAG: methylenetetrahydrofolate reductase C-terminal domain-containing protein, partial [Deltaproteobacteria bacterium]|nr:methylenetetrahydrofolate reductase C-terminal domain-containing protein [Deltaproteobacteria bacterium]
MIITKKKTIEDITASLEGKKSVYLFGCNSCAEQCKTGGAEELKSMTETLTDKGFKVTGSSLVDETCYTQLVKREFRKVDAVKKSDAVLVLSCGAGVKCVADEAEDIGDGTQTIVPALDSMFLSSVERVGRFFEGCSLCGECVLDKTAGICPHTDCPKGLLNGPCGGVDEGKCEVMLDNDCAWVRIYTRLKAQGRLELMEEIASPKDYSTTTRPRNVLLR